MTPSESVTLDYGAVLCYDRQPYSNCHARLRSYWYVSVKLLFARQSPYKTSTSTYLPYAYNLTFTV